ncbi:MAG TPA: hypothetical protein VLD62_12255, partial [Acidimicrobiia bacterium]|nr:hypothetical protein [Acidimicrobiia bacterium]
MSDTPNVRRLVSTKRLAGVGLVVGLMVMALIGVARANHDPDGDWVLQGTGEGRKKAVPVSFTTNNGATASFEYNVPDNPNFRREPIDLVCSDVNGDGALDEWNGSWRFETKANKAGSRQLAWSWEGSHAFTNVNLETYIVANGSFRRLLKEDFADLPSGSFSFSDTTTIEVEAESYGFVLCMRNGDTGAALEGSFSVQSLPTFGSSTTADPAVVTLDQESTISVTFDGNGHLAVGDPIDTVIVTLPDGVSLADPSDDFEPVLDNSVPPAPIPGTFTWVSATGWAIGDESSFAVSGTSFGVAILDLYAEATDSQTNAVTTRTSVELTIDEPPSLTVPKHIIAEATSS